MADAKRDAWPRCPECGEAVECGSALGRERCWCQDLTQLRVIDPDAPACLCERCLRQRLSREAPADPPG